MNNRAYSTSEVAQITGFSVRQLDYWFHQSIIVPSIQSSSGPGTKRLYSFDDLVQIRFISRLKSHGWSTQKIREAVLRLREILKDESALQKALMISGKNTILAIYKNAEGERQLFDILSAAGQQVMWIYLETLIKETSTQVALAVGHE